MRRPNKIFFLLIFLSQGSRLLSYLTEHYLAEVISLRHSAQHEVQWSGNEVPGLTHGQARNGVSGIRNCLQNIRRRLAGLFRAWRRGHSWHVWLHTLAERPRRQTRKILNDPATPTLQTIS
jgi:hypothetical protein